MAVMSTSKTANYDDRFGSIDKQLDKLISAMVKGFDRIDKILEQKADKADLERLYGLADSLAKRQEICDQERLVMGHQLERHNRWMHSLADKAGIQLST